MSEDAVSPPEPEAVQCEITGRWVSADAVVTIQGHRVCAEGKAELLERLRSGELMHGEMERSTVLRRLGALLLDGIIVGAVNLALTLLVLGTLIPGATTPGGPAALGAPFAAVQVIGALFTLAYFTILHGTRGQTVGKMAVRIKVVDANGAAISMGTALTRALFYQGPGIVAMIIMAFAAMNGSAGGVIASTAVNGLGSVYIFVSVIVALVDQAQQRTIHDRLAGTRVILLG
jgi:uncharacterized RDD family membrane protein YckC